MVTVKTFPYLSFQYASHKKADRMVWSMVTTIWGALATLEKKKGEVAVSRQRI